MQYYSVPIVQKLTCISHKDVNYMCPCSVTPASYLILYTPPLFIFPLGSVYCCLGHSMAKLIPCCSRCIICPRQGHSKPIPCCSRLISSILQTLSVLSLNHKSRCGKLCKQWILRHQFCSIVYKLSTVCKHTMLELCATHHFRDVSRQESC